MNFIFSIRYLYTITIVIAITIGFIKSTGIAFVLKARLQGAEQYVGAIAGLQLLRSWAPITSSAFFIIITTIYLNDPHNSYQKIIRSSLIILIGIICSATFIFGSILSSIILFDISLQVYLEHFFTYITWLDLGSLASKTLFMGFILFYINYNKKIRTLFGHSMCLKSFFNMFTAFYLDYLHNLVSSMRNL